jgi:hypothetical protein
MARLTVEVERRKPNTRETDRYVGRFLGFVKDDEFNAIIQNISQVAGRIETSETKEFMPIAMKTLELLGCRLVMSLRKKNEKTVLAKTLFISGKLDFVHEVLPSEGRIRVTTESGDELVVVEKEDI